MDKYYYIDKEGNKKKYVGKVIFDNVSYSGILTSVSQETVKKVLEYHPEVEGVEGYLAYYTYTNNAGEDTPYLDIIKKDDDNNFYFTYNEKNIFDLIYHPEVIPVEEHYTYMDAEGNEQRYSGNIIYDKASKTYFGFLEK